MRNDLELHKRGETVSSPFPFPTQLFFDIIFNYNNQKFLTSKYFMPTINLYRSYLVIRETVNSRETYRNSNRAMENFIDVLHSYDEIIVGHLQKVVPANKRLMDLIGPEKKRILG
jgi:hypothetical protein